jgi:hypothetical protein
MMGIAVVLVAMLSVILVVFLVDSDDDGANLNENTIIESTHGGEKQNEHRGSSRFDTVFSPNGLLLPVLEDEQQHKNDSVAAPVKDETDEPLPQQRPGKSTIPTQNGKMQHGEKENLLNDAGRESDSASAPQTRTKNGDGVFTSDDGLATSANATATQTTTLPQQPAEGANQSAENDAPTTKNDLSVQTDTGSSSEKHQDNTAQDNRQPKEGFQSDAQPNNDDAKNDALDDIALPTDTASLAMTKTQHPVDSLASNGHNTDSVQAPKEEDNKEAEPLKILPDDRKVSQLKLAFAFDDFPKFSNGLPPMSIGLLYRTNANKRFAFETGLIYNHLRTNYAIPNTELLASVVDLHYIGVPFRFVVKIWSDSKWNVYFSSGGMVEKGFKSVATEYFYQNSEKAGETKTTKSWSDGFQYSAYGGLGVSYHFTDFVGIFIEPNLKYYFDANPQSESIYTEQPFIFGFTGGLQINF